MDDHDAGPPAPPVPTAPPGRPGLLAVRHLQNGRDNNEDSYTVFSLPLEVGGPEVVVLAIADGMGGYSHGEDVSREALLRLAHGLFDQWVIGGSLNALASAVALPDAHGLGTALLEAVRLGHAQVRRMVERGGWGKAGSTVVATALARNAGAVVNLGDSPLFHYSAGSGELHKLTQDHTIAGVLLREGLLTEEMARVHEGRSRLEFYLGGPNLPREEPVRHFTLQGGDVLLLCSDGVSGLLREAQIREALAGPDGDLEKMADRLVEAACAEGETDNQTLILWRHPATAPVVAPEPPPPSPADPKEA